MCDLWCAQPCSLSCPTHHARTLRSAHPQAPRLRELRCCAFLDLWSGPWDGLARMASLRSLELVHHYYGEHSAAYACDLHERGLLGWLMGQAQQGRPQWGGSLAAHPPAAVGAERSSAGGGQGPAVELPAQRFELAWLPRGLERCSIELPPDTNLVPLPPGPAGAAHPKAFRVDATTVELG
jgi:hypothetical protein